MQNYLASLGYDLIALPKASIAPLQLFTLEGDHFSLLDEQTIDLLFEADLAPNLSPSRRTADISGKKGFSTDLKTNLGAMSALFKIFGLNDSDLKLKADRNTNLQIEFTYENVTEELVWHTNLDNFLTGAIPLENEFRTYEERLKRSELGVITHVLRSNKFSIRLTDDRGTDVHLDAAVEPFAAAKIALERNRNNGFTVEHQGDEALAFAYKGVQILYDKAAWWQFWKATEANFRIKNQQGHTLRGPEDFPVITLTGSNRFIDL